MVHFGPRWIPAPKIDYGQTIVAVVVGSFVQKTFTVHKNLLFAASVPFEDAYASAASERTEANIVTITLGDWQPFTFEVVQRWLYNGLVEDAHTYSRNHEYSPDVFWLMVYELATIFEIKAIQVIAFERFETVFSPHEASMPSLIFIEMLYDTELKLSNTRMKALQVYLARHVGYWVAKAPEAAGAWNMVLRWSKDFVSDAAVEITRYLSFHARDPQAFDIEHPAYSRGAFAMEHSLDLNTMRAEARDRIKSFAEVDEENDRSGRKLRIASMYKLKPRDDAIPTRIQTPALIVKRPYSAPEVAANSKKAKSNKKRTSDHSEESQEI